jgi:hypothetical protein
VTASPVSSSTTVPRDPEPPPGLDWTRSRKRTRRAVLISLGVVAVIALLAAAYSPMMDYTSPFSTTGFVACSSLLAILPSNGPDFPPSAHVTVLWGLNGSTTIPLTFYVDVWIVSHSGHVTTYQLTHAASWNRSSGWGTFVSNGGAYFFEGLLHPEPALPPGQCPDLTLEVSGFYVV